MKRAWMGVIGCLLMGALPLACGKPTAEAVCEKGAECGKLMEGVTEQQCVNNSNETLAKLRAVPECAELADATEESFQCAAALSCAELEVFLKDESGMHKCDEPLKAVSIGSATDCARAQGQ
jgi:hypothetical protein